MERSMLGVTLRDKIRNEELCRRTKVTDAIKRITHLKWNRAGHAARMSDNRWTRKKMASQKEHTKTGNHHRLNVRTI